MFSRWPAITAYRSAANAERPSHTEAEHFKSCRPGGRTNHCRTGSAKQGMLLDPQFGMAGLEQLEALAGVARPIEITKSRPLEVEAGANLAGEIATWSDSCR